MMMLFPHRLFEQLAKSIIAAASKFWKTAEGLLKLGELLIKKIIF